jgi:hypothetical protein
VLSVQAGANGFDYQAEGARGCNVSVARIRAVVADVHDTFKSARIICYDRKLTAIVLEKTNV